MHPYSKMTTTRFKRHTVAVFGMTFSLLGATAADVRANPPQAEPVFELAYDSAVADPFHDYVFSDFQIAVPSKSALYQYAGCEMLRLLIPQAEFEKRLRSAPSASEADNGPPARVDINGRNVFECSGGPMVPQVNFVAKNKAGRLTVEYYDLDHRVTQFELDEPAAPKRVSRSLADVANRTGWDTENGDAPSPLQLAEEATLVIQTVFLDRVDHLDEEVYKSVRGTVRRARWTGERIHGTWWGVPTYYASPWIDSSDLPTGKTCHENDRRLLRTIAGLSSRRTLRQHGYDCGHMLGNQLGGTGRQDVPSNTIIFPQDYSVNEGIFRVHETKIKQIIQPDRLCVDCEAGVKLWFNYFPLVPRINDSEVYRVYVSQFSVTCKGRLIAKFGGNAHTFRIDTHFPN